MAVPPSKKDGSGGPRRATDPAGSSGETGGNRPSLGLDFGTSNTVAVLRWPDGRTRPLLFDGSPLLPSAVFADDADLLAGRDAQHAARLRPERYEPNPKRRVDDGTVLLGQHQVDVVDLFAAVLRRVRVEAQRVLTGVEPTVTLTHPAAWGERRRATLLAAAERAGIQDAKLVSEPIAAATHYLAVVRPDIGLDTPIVVYDLGGGTFDASVLERAADGLRVLASAGLTDTGGLDIDAAIVGYLGTTLNDTERETWSRLMRPRTEVERRAYRLLWEDVSAAKEMLSRTRESNIYLPLVDRGETLTRDQLETLARPILDRTVAATEQAIKNAGRKPDDVAAVFLVGGSSRIPLVATLLQRALGASPVTAELPEQVVADGAGLAASVVLPHLAHSAPAPLVDTEQWSPPSPPWLLPVSAPPVSSDPAPIADPTPPATSGNRTTIDGAGAGGNAVAKGGAAGEDDSAIGGDPLDGSVAADADGSDAALAESAPVSAPPAAPVSFDRLPLSAEPVSAPPASPLSTGESASPDAPAGTVDDASSTPSDEPSVTPGAAEPVSVTPDATEPASVAASVAEPTSGTQIVDPGPFTEAFADVAPRKVAPVAVGAADPWLTAAETEVVTGLAAFAVGSPLSTPARHDSGPIGDQPAGAGPVSGVPLPMTLNVGDVPGFVPPKPPRRLRTVLVAAGAVVLAGVLAGALVLHPWSTGHHSPAVTAPYEGRTTEAVSYTKGDNSGPAPVPVGANRGGALTVQTDLVIPRLDPSVAHAATELEITHLIYRPLTALRTNANGSTTLVGDLATDPGTDVDHDCRTWRYILRPGLTYADGTPIVAADVLRGVSRAFNPALVNGFTTLQRWLTGDGTRGTGFSATFQAPGVSAPDPRTLVFTFPKPHCDAPYAMSLPTTAPVPANIPAGTDYNANPAGAGPYVVDHRTDTEIVLHRNPHWDAASDPLRTAGPDTIDFQLGLPSADIATRLVADATADQSTVSWAAISPFKDATALAPLGDRVVSGRVNSPLYLYFNTARMNNPTLRQAIVMAVNRPEQEPLRSTDIESVEATSTLLPPGVTGYTTVTSPYAYDPAAAKALLGGTTYTLTLGVNTSNNRPAQAAAVKADLAQIGITVNIVVAPNSNALKAAAADPKSTYDMSMLTVTPDWPAGYHMLEELFDGRTANPENYSQLHDTAIESEFTRLDQSPIAQQNSGASALDLSLQKSTVAMPIYNELAHYPRGANVGGLYVSAVTGVPCFNTVYLLNAAGSPSPSASS